MVTCIARLVIPNECEGSKNDLSLWSRQGFLPEFTLSFAEGVETTTTTVLYDDISLSHRKRRP